MRIAGNRPKVEDEDERPRNMRRCRRTSARRVFLSSPTYPGPNDRIIIIIEHVCARTRSRGRMRRRSLSNARQSFAMWPPSHINLLYHPHHRCPHSIRNHRITHTSLTDAAIHHLTPASLSRFGRLGNEHETQSIDELDRQCNSFLLNSSINSSISDRLHATLLQPELKCEWRGIQENRNILRTLSIFTIFRKEENEINGWMPFNINQSGFHKKNRRQKRDRSSFGWHWPVCSMYGLKKSLVIPLVTIIKNFNQIKPILKAVLNQNKVLQTYWQDDECL